MEEVPRVLNAYDAEVVYFPPRTTNLEFTLPNKYFEAVQGRLAVITGDSPSLVAEIVKRQNGVVVHGWSAEALARGINSLTAEQIYAAKKNSHSAAGTLSSDTDRARFLACLA
jgi:glycosyltransferase involved in cell wall biosynthesis